MLKKTIILTTKNGLEQSSLVTKKLTVFAISILYKISGNKFSSFSDIFGWIGLPSKQKNK